MASSPYKDILSGAGGKSKPNFTAVYNGEAFVRIAWTKASPSQILYALSIFTAISSAIFIMLVKVV